MAEAHKTGSYEPLWPPSRVVEEILPVSESTLRVWRETGYGPPWVQLGERRYGYRPSEVWRWVLENEVVPGGRR